MGKGVARRAALALITVSLGALSAATAHATEGTITGASEASCEPASCGPASGLRTVTLSAVANDDGTTSTRAYDVYRPQNLGGRAPAVLVFYGGGACGQHVTSRFAELAPANRFIVVYMEIPCRTENFWEKRNVDAPTTTTPDDEPYVKAVVDDLTLCPGECADPHRLYAAGMSSGGSMVADVMCDVQNSQLFRGYLIDSSSLQLFEGAPHCPSPNRSFFVMLALGDTGLDAGLYHDTAPNPHFDVPDFTDWVADRLGCPGPLQSGSLGSPLGSTPLTFSYSGPCAYAAAGSQAVRSLGILDGAHGWACQDSDPRALPDECPTMPTPPGLDAAGLPQTDGLFVEGDFWSFVAQGVSSAKPAPALTETTPPIVTITAPAQAATISGTVSMGVHASDNTSVANVRLQLDGASLGVATPSGEAGTYSLLWDTTAVANGTHRVSALAVDSAGNLAIVSRSIVVSNRGGGGGGGTAGGGPGSGPAARTPSQVQEPGPPSVPPAPAEPPRWLALGDDFAAGDAGLPAGSSENSCLRSRAAYPLLTAARLGVPAPALRACAGARIATFYRPDRRTGEPSQLSWLGATTDLVTVSVGWNDAGLSAAIARCGSRPDRCHSGWSPTTEGAISSMRSSRGDGSLRALFRSIRANAPDAKIVIIGYPRLFPPRRVAPCRIGSAGLSFGRRAMRWANGAVGRLDDAIGAAAHATHATFVNAYGAFGGRELCSPRPFLDSTLHPNHPGQRELGALLARVLESS